MSCQHKIEQYNIYGMILPQNPTFWNKIITAKHITCTQFFFFLLHTYKPHSDLQTQQHNYSGIICLIGSVRLHFPAKTKDDIKYPTIEQKNSDFKEMA